MTVLPQLTHRHPVRYFLPKTLGFSFFFAAPKGLRFIVDFLFYGSYSRCHK